MKFFQNLGKSIMLPVACMPLCGILMGIGYLMCPASMQGGAVTGLIPVIGMFLVKAGGALIDHIALLFAVGIGVGMSDDQHGTAGVTALVSWLIITSLLSAGFIQTIMPAIAENATALLAFQKIENPFIGILSGVIGAGCYNRFKKTKLPEWLAFFSGRRSTVIVAGFVSVVVSAALFFVWPVLFGGLVRLGQGIAGMGAVGAGIYAFLNRLLIPLGLHHALNNVFWFDTIGLGDLTHFWAGDTSADVPWSLGIYMSGFFPCMMFGVPGAALAMIRSAKESKRKYAIGILASGALCAFVCGITEPLEFSFMFAAPALYVVYAALYGIFTFITALSGFRAGFSFSAGAIDLIFSAPLPAAQKTWLILPLGAAAFVVFFAVFMVLIRMFHFQTPGNELDETEEGGVIAGAASAVAAVETAAAAGTIAAGTADAGAAAESAGTSAAGAAGSAEELKAPAAVRVEGVDVTAVLEALGGKDNIVTLDNCATRLRVELKDGSLVDDKKIKAAGARGVIKPGKNAVQVIIGMKVQAVADAAKQLLA